MSLGPALMTSHGPYLDSSIDRLYMPRGSSRRSVFGSRYCLCSWVDLESYVAQMQRSPAETSGVSSRRLIPSTSKSVAITIGCVSVSLHANILRERRCRYTSCLMKNEQPMMLCTPCGSGVYMCVMGTFISPTHVSMVAILVTCCTILLPSLIVRNLQGLISAPIFIAH
jgi:hypothetical protein